MDAAPAGGVAAAGVVVGPPDDGSHAWWDAWQATTKMARAARASTELAARMAAALAALLPIHVLYSAAGRVDHHVFLACEAQFP